MDRRSFLELCIATGLTAGQGRARAAGGGGARPNVLWILMDDARPDALSCYGQPWAQTPHMDSIAARGVRFETAATQCPICVPSRTSLKTSQYAHQTGVMSMGKPPETSPPYRAREFPNLLNTWTAAGVRPVNVGKRHAFVEDWQFEGDPRAAKSGRKDTGKTYPPVRLTTHQWQIGGTEGRHPDDTRMAQITNKAIEVLKRLADAGEPFFLRASFHAPHVPIQVPASFMVDPESVTLPYPTKEELDAKPRLEREQLRVYAGTTDLSRESVQVARGTYYGMVKLMDHHVGRLLEAFREHGLLDNTVVAVNSDHGLQMGEHGLHKKRNFYEETINTPMLFACPGRLPEGKVIPDLVEMVDFVPTLMDLCGFEAPGSIAGRSLVPLMHGKAPGREAIFAEIDHSGSMYDELRVNSGRRVMVRTRDWKLEYFRDPRVKDKDGALYDLKNDPQECFNLYNDSSKASVIAELEQRVENWDSI